MRIKIEEIFKWKRILINYNFILDIFLCLYSYSIFFLIIILCDFLFFSF